MGKAAYSTAQFVDLHGRVSSGEFNKLDRDYSEFRHLEGNIYDGLIYLYTQIFLSKQQRNAGQ